MNRLLILAAVILLSAVIFLSWFSEKPDIGITGDIDDELVQYFVQRLRGRFISLVGQPIEGFTPEMFMQVWPGLGAKDFDSAEALGGRYEMQGGGLNYVERAGGVKTSADEAIIAAGMRTLLGNVSARAGISITSGTDIDQLLVSLLEGDGGANTATIRGTVMLGPTCPVMRDPPDPACADRPYATRLVLTTPDGARVIREFDSDADGTFEINILPGEYAVRSTAAANILPYCASQDTIEIKAGEILDVPIFCDTGIR